MSFVLRNKRTGLYRTGRHGQTDDINRARTYSRAVDASNSDTRVAYERVPVHVSLYANTPTVVVVLATDDMANLVLIRRNNEPGRGLLGLPGGYQMAGETWRWAGHREVAEETGLCVDPESLKLVSLDTDEYGNNLLICRTQLPVTKMAGGPEEGETQEVVVVDKLPAPEEVAFPRHYEAMKAYFAEWPRSS